MSDNILTIQLMPSYRSTAEKMGFDVEEMDIEANNDAVLFQQGFNIDLVEFEPGDKFKIPVEVERAIVSCDETNYRLIENKFDGRMEVLSDGEDSIELGAGEYHFHVDGITIERLSINMDSDTAFENE